MPKTEEELKQEAEAAAAAEAQAAKSLEDELSLDPPKNNEEEDDDIDSLKSRLAKAEGERENYKQGMLKYKSEAEGKKDETVIEEVKDNTEEFKTIAAAEANRAIEKANEKVAISQFVEDYPAMKDPQVWRKFVENLLPNIDKSSPSAIRRGLEATLAAAKVLGGGTIANKEIKLNNLASVSGVGSGASREEENASIKESTIEMGRRFGTSIEDLKKVSEPGGNEIRIV